MAQVSATQAAAPAELAPAVAPPPAQAAPARKVTAPRRPSGRERHDEKITVYVSPDELIGLEHARIMLRGEYGLAVDRGRIVREAVAALLADLDARGRDSILVKRLSAGG
ncbi:cobyrinic acid a,c-diamide synthase [Catenulispora sp. NF23]|nr:cobyrinic acid a,c-diamide synthase [Catenulispora pinistramenti]